MGFVCTVCGYRHQGDKPPASCPRCGAHMYRFISAEPLPEELEQGMKLVFAAESKAQARNQAFAARAAAEELPQIARLFKAVARAESVHAAEALRYLQGVVGDTGQNLKSAFEREMAAKQEGYPPLIKKAFDLGREDVAWSLIRARDVEGRHAALYKSALSALAGDRAVDYHVCRVCGYVFEGAPPERCPVCGSGRDEFEQIV